MSASGERELVLVHGHRKRLVRLIPEIPVVIGRSPDADFFLNAPSISRRHCSIVFSAGAVEAQDLGSRNSSFLNGRKITKAFLADGSMLQLGKVPFVVQFLGEEEESLDPGAIECSRCGATIPPGETNEGEVLVCPECWSVVEISSSKNIWDELKSEGFDVEELIGSDPPVFRARRTDLGRVCRVKVLPLREDQDPKQVDRFLKEARMAASLLHPHIEQVLDIRRGKGLLYVVMEYVEGKTLAELIEEEGPKSLEDAVTLAAQLCEALAYAHGRQVVHGDVHPGTIFISTDGAVKLRDFSGARDLDALSALSASVSFNAHDKEFCTLAPEVFSAPDKVDERADVYGIGYVLAFALKGSTPFPGITMVQMAQMLATKSKVECSLEGVPAEACSLLEACLSVTPEGRPRSISTLRERLKDIGQSASFVGNISGNALVEFCQIIEMNTKTGILTIEGDRRGQIKVRHGRIIEARFEGGSGETQEAVYALLALRDGKFRFTDKSADELGDGDASLNIQGTLLNLLRELDESGFG